MRASQLLNIWERAALLPPVERPLTLLEATRPEARRDDLAALSIGERDARLLNLREEIFGSIFEIFASCPRCSERFEFSVEAVDLRQALRRSKEAGLREGPLEFVAADFRLRFRLPNSLDLSAAAGAAQVAEARKILIERCLLEVRRNGQTHEPSEAPEEVLEQFASEISRRDPGAEILMNVHCPACGHEWTIIFDVASFFWEELSALAKRLVREVAILARNFGWSEAEILAMTPTRREIYLELAQ